MKLKPKFKGYSEAQLLVLAEKDINIMSFLLSDSFSLLLTVLMENNLGTEDFIRSKTDFSVMVQQHHQFLANASFRSKTPRKKYRKMVLEQKIFLFSTLSRLVTKAGEFIEESGTELIPEVKTSFNENMEKINFIGENAKYVFTK